MTMEITVIAGCGSETTLQVESDMTIFDLKHKMQGVHGVLIADQDLYFGNTCLKDWDRLKDYGIQNGAQLKVMVKHRLVVHGPKPKESYRLTVHKDVTLRQMKEMLTKQFGLNMNDKKLILGDETLHSGTLEKLILGRKPPKTVYLEDDDATLGDLGVDAESYVKFLKKEN